MANSLPRLLTAGDEIHYIALLNEHGETLTTVPLEVPLKCGDDGVTRIDARVNLHVMLEGRASR